MLCRQLGPQKELLELLLEELNGWQVGTVHVHMAHQTVGFLGPFQFSQNVDQEHFLTVHKSQDADQGFA